MKIFFHYSCYVVSKLLFTSSTSLDRYWGKHKIFQAEIENRISAFKQKGAREYLSLDILDT